MKVNGNHLKLLVSLIFLVLPFIGFSTTDPPPFLGCPDPYEACPIDGGVSLLIAAGIGLGAKKAYNERNKKKVIASNTISK